MVLHMVSQKEKQRLREEKERLESYDQMRVVNAQAALARKLEDLILSGQQKQKNVKTVKKLIKDTQYTEELKSIGLNATKLALQVYYQNNRPTDALELLKQEELHQQQGDDHGDDDDDDDDVVALLLEDTYCCQIGLWSAIKEQNWQVGLPFAKQLFRRYDDKTDFTSVVENNADTTTTISPSTQELLHYVIQTFAANDYHVEKATKLWTRVVLKASSDDDSEEEKVDQVLSQASLESLLKSHQSARRTKEFKDLFSQVFKETVNSNSFDVSFGDGLKMHVEGNENNNNNDETNKTVPPSLCLLKKSSYEMALEVAASEGDLELMLRTIELIPSKRSVSEQLLILKTIATNLGGGGPAGAIIIKPTEPLLMISLMVLKTLLTSDPKQSANLDLGDFVSRVICSLEDDEEVVELAVLLNNNKKGTKKRKKTNNAAKASPLLLLSDSARARIFPLLGKWELNQSKKVTTIPKTSVVWELLSSFLAFNKGSGALTDSTRAFLRAQTLPDFHIWVLSLAEEYVENKEGFQGVFAECSPHAFSRQTSEKYSDDLEACNDLLDLLVRSFTKAFPFEDDMKAIRFFSDTLSTFTFPTEKSPVDISDLPTLQNEKVAMIMASTVRWLRENAEKMAKTAGGLGVVHLGMFLVSEMKECRGRHLFENEGPTDNGAKEALQAIMKETLVLNLFQDDVQMVDTAINYYRELGFAAQASSTISYSDLFCLPFEGSMMGVVDRGDGYDIREEFRRRVLGLPKASADKKGFFEGMVEKVNKFALSQLSEEGAISDESIAYLRDIIREMAILGDQKTGNSHRLEETFIRNYQELFLQTQGLFLDFDLSHLLCRTYWEESSLESFFMQDSSVSLPGGIEIGVDNSSMRRQLPQLSNPLLNDDFAKRLIERLAGLEDIRFSVTLAEEGRVSKEKRLESFVLILLHIHDLVRYFNENKSIHSAYSDAAHRNTNFVVDQVANVLAAEKTLISKGNRAKKASMADDAFTSMEEFFVNVSKSIRSPVLRGPMEERLSAIQPLVKGAFRFYFTYAGWYREDRIKKMWPNNEAILPEIREWIFEELEEIRS